MRPVRASSRRCEALRSDRAAASRNDNRSSAKAASGGDAYVGSIESGAERRRWSPFGLLVAACIIAIGVLAVLLAAYPPGLVPAAPPTAREAYFACIAEWGYQSDPDGALTDCRRQLPRADDFNTEHEACLRLRGLDSDRNPVDYLDEHCAGYLP